MHFFDLRSKADAQDEIRDLCELLMTEFEGWMPELAAWYKANRYGKARLAP
jgi:thymidylate synthase (FAD)